MFFYEFHQFLQDEGAIMMSYSNLSTFFSGLEGKVGSPDPKVEEAMRAEHCEKADCHEPYKTGNYAINTSSTIEFWFVVEPTCEDAVTARKMTAAATGDKLGQHGYPRFDRRRPHCRSSSRISSGRGGST